MHKELKEELKLYQASTEEKIQDLNIKVANQQETIQFLMNQIEKNGIKLFCDEIKDDESES